MRLVTVNINNLYMKRDQKAIQLQFVMHIYIYIHTYTHLFGSRMSGMRSMAACWATAVLSIEAAR